MRLFQISSTRPWHRQRTEQLLAGQRTFAEMERALHEDGIDGVHTLEPILVGSENAFFTHENNERLQRAWAREHGLPESLPLVDILLAQIEEQRAEVVYCLSTQAVDSSVARRMPGSVRAKIGFNAAPSVGHDMSAYLMVCNFPTLLDSYRRMGLRTAYFAPAHDSILDSYASSDKRDIDVLFVGTYSRFHKRRAAYIEAVAGLQARHKVVLALLRSRLNRIAETPLGWFGPLKKYSRPVDVRAIAQGAVYGRDYYALLSRAKIVLNGAGDIGGDDRGNMRCWEALGARALMVSDVGNYPEGFIDGETMRTYRTPEEAVAVIEEALANPAERRRIADAGYAMVTTRYSKSRQWQDFQKLVADHF